MGQEEHNNKKLNLDNWNQRLDQNLEGRQQGDVKADQKAEDFNNNCGSDHLRDVGAGEVEDNMKINQPVPGTPTAGEIEREE